MLMWLYIRSVRREVMLAVRANQRRPRGKIGGDMESAWCTVLLSSRVMSHHVALCRSEAPPRMEEQHRRKRTVGEVEGEQ